MLYLPRLFIYHSDSVPGSEQARTFSVMEHRLVTVIMTPAMVVSWVLGLYLAGLFSASRVDGSTQSLRRS